MRVKFEVSLGKNNLIDAKLFPKDLSTPIQPEKHY